MLKKVVVSKMETTASDGTNYNTNIFSLQFKKQTMGDAGKPSVATIKNFFIVQ